MMTRSDGGEGQLFPLDIRFPITREVISRIEAALSFIPVLGGIPCQQYSNYPIRDKYIYLSLALFPRRGSATPKVVGISPAGMV